MDMSSLQLLVLHIYEELHYEKLNCAMTVLYAVQ